MYNNQTAVGSFVVSTFGLRGTMSTWSAFTSLGAWEPQDQEEKSRSFSLFCRFGLLHYREAIDGFALRLNRSTSKSESDVICFVETTLTEDNGAPLPSHVFLEPLFCLSPTNSTLVSAWVTNRGSLSSPPEKAKTLLSSANPLCCMWHAWS